MTIADFSPTNTAAPVFVTAEVLETEDRGQFVRVSASGQWDEPDFWARLATGPLSRPCVGDQVLIAGAGSTEAYVIGCLTPPAADRLTSANGTYAECCKDQSGHEVVRVLTRNDELMFEYDPEKQVTRVAVPQGSLELMTAKGDLTLNAAGTVRIAGSAIEITARRRLSMAVVNAVGKAKSWFRMLEGRLHTGGAKFDLVAEETELNSPTTRLNSNEVSVNAGQVHVEAEHLETAADTRVERSGSVYQTVVDVLQQQTGRLRTYVSGLSHFRSKRAYFSSEESFNIDGDKVNLG